MPSKPKSNKPTLASPAPKAKPTVFDGETYDSQLEARGAVFLDYHPLVSSWRPKPGVFNIDGEEYTPDFIIRILGVEIIVEVKPMDPSVQHREKLMRVANYTRLEVIYLIGGWFKEEIPYIRTSTDDFEKPVSLHRHVLGSGRLPKIIEAVKAIRFDLNQIHNSKRIQSDADYEQTLAQWQLFSRRLKK